MEDQHRASRSPEPHSASSETEKHADTFQYDNDEEMILLHMAEVNDAPPSPGLKAAMEKSRLPNETLGQQKPASLLMERPKSSGIDVTAFCFAKPSGKNFSVQSSKRSTKQSPAQETIRNEQETTEAPTRQTDTRHGLLFFFFFLCLVNLIIVKLKLTNFYGGTVLPPYLPRLKYGIRPTVTRTVKTRQGHSHPPCHTYTTRQT